MKTHNYSSLNQATSAVQAKARGGGDQEPKSVPEETREQDPKSKSGGDEEPRWAEEEDAP